MKKEIIPLVLVLLIGSSFGLSVNLIEDDGKIYNNLYIDTRIPTAAPAYKDGGYVNPDLGIEVCDTTSPAGKWVALFYALNESPKYIAISKNLSTSTPGVMAKLGNSYLGDNGLICANVTPSLVGIIDYPISDPYVYDEPAYFPAKVWAAVSDSPDLLNAVFIPTNINFLGNYSSNDYQSTYDVSNGNITLEVTGISAITLNSAGKPSIISVSAPTDSLIVGTCEDNQGIHCNDVKMETQQNLQSGIQLNTGHVDITDQNPHNMYLLINGIPYPLDLGADLIVSSIKIDHNPVFYGEKFNVTLNVTNIGNVNVTHPFNVSLTFWRNIQGTTYQNVTLKQLYNTTALGNITPGKTVSLVFNYIAKPQLFPNDSFNSTGTMEIVANADSSNNIKETKENNNVLVSSFTYSPDYEPEIYINGIKSYTFNYSGRVYNVTFSFIKRPDNNKELPNSFLLVRESKLNIFVPSSDQRISSENIININGAGLSSITLPVIPLKTNTSIGENEKIYIWIPGGKIFDPRTKEAVDHFYLNISNTSYEQPTSMGIVNSQTIRDIFSFIYKLYSNIFGEVGL